MGTPRTVCAEDPICWSDRSAERRAAWLALPTAWSYKVVLATVFSCVSGTPPHMWAEKSETL